MARAGRRCAPPFLTMISDLGPHRTVFPIIRLLLIRTIALTSLTLTCTWTELHASYLCKVYSYPRPCTGTSFFMGFARVFIVQFSCIVEYDSSMITRKIHVSHCV
jgi:hypothetical protein